MTAPPETIESPKKSVMRMIMLVLKYYFHDHDLFSEVEIIVRLMCDFM